MEEEQQIKPTNKYIEYIKVHKYNVYFIGAIVVLLLLITGMVFLISSTNSSKNVTNTNGNISSKNNTPSSGTGKLSPTSLPVPIITLDPTQTAVIQNQTAPQITPNIAVPYTVTNITQYGSSWSVMTINNPDVGNARVIAKKVNNSWKVVAGPGTYFPPDQLNSLGAPQELVNSFINPPSVSVSPSPTPFPGDIQ